MSISVVIPAYKEAENLEELLPKLNAVLLQIKQPYEILVIDTMSRKDNTEEICQKNKCAYVNRENGNGYGDAIRTGIRKASNKYLVVMDADGSHNSGDIVKFYEAIEKGYDLIIGSRYIVGGNSHNGLILKLMSYILNITYRMFFNIKAKDISNSFRMYRAEQLKSLVLECNNFDIVEEIIIKLSVSILQFKLLEVPIFFDQRKHGESKRDLKKFIFSYIATIRRLLQFKVNGGNSD
ncbi:MAG: glycosyltransferase [Bacteroidales bacterium]|jgi:dolichol-phosphate mannosyltransferase|nr:glycosyltransferase [Bacteroidales bacterium]